MKKGITISGIVLLMAVFAIPAFGRWGRGPHMLGYGGGGPGWCGNYYGTYGSLTQDQQNELKQLDQKFRDEMIQLRNAMWSKWDERTRLLDSENPDPDNLKTLQKEISDIRSKMDALHLNYELEAREIAPDVGPRRGSGWGYRRGYGQRMGPGPGMGFRYGPGYGMMSPRETYGSTAQEPLTEQDARAVVEDYLNATNNPNLKLGQIEEKKSSYIVEILTKDGSLVDKIAVDKHAGWIRSVY
jgi:hypothetical protein